MKQIKYLFFCFLILLITPLSEVKAQLSEGKAQIAVDDPDQIHKFWISGLTMAPRNRLNFIEAKYFHNNKWFFSVELGTTTVGEGGLAGGIYATYTLFSKTTIPKKDKKVQLGKDYSRKYFLMTPIKEKNAFGLRGGFDYTYYDESVSRKGNNTLVPHTFGALVMGVSYYKQSFTRIIVNNSGRPKFVQRTRFLSLTADAVYYAVLPEASPLLSNRSYNPFAFRCGMDGFFSFASAKAWGLFLGVGGEVGPESGKFTFRPYYKLMLYMAIGARTETKKL